jgi:hypothetical protein
LNSSHKILFLTRGRLSTQILFGLAVLVLALIGASPSRAEPPGGADRKNQLGLYLWVPGVSGSMTVGGETVPIDITTGEALTDLTVGGPLAYTRTPEPWGALVTAVFVGIDSEFTTSGTNRPGTQTVDFFMVDAVANRRWGFSDDRVGVELLLGLRYWKLEQGFVIENDPEREDSVNWYDGVLGGRVTVQMANNWWFIGRLDGAAGGSDETWNSEAMFQWRASRLFSLTFGYRFLRIKYETGSESTRFDLDADIAGPAVGFLFSF